MKRMAYLFFILAFLCMLLFSACGKYRSADFLGKTSVQIEIEFGTFDCIGVPADADGLYRNCRCGYTIQKPQTGFLGTQPERIYFIRFDENGIAVSCEEDYRPGG